MKFLLISIIAAIVYEQLVLVGSIAVRRAVKTSKTTTKRTTKAKTTTTLSPDTISLFNAISIGDLNGVKSAIANGANVNSICKVRSYAADSPLNTLLGFSQDNIDIANALIDANENVNYISKVGNTALYLACKRDFTDIALALLKAGAGATINYQNINQLNTTPLIEAAARGNIVLVTALVNTGANVNLTDTENHTALYYAINPVFDPNPDFDKVVSYLKQLHALNQ